MCRCYCILHEENVLAAIFSIWKDLRRAESWEEVEQTVWGELNEYKGFPWSYLPSQRIRLNFQFQKLPAAPRRFRQRLIIDLFVKIHSSIRHTDHDRPRLLYDTIFIFLPIAPYDWQRMILFTGRGNTFVSFLYVNTFKLLSTGLVVCPFPISSTITSSISTNVILGQRFGLRGKTSNQNKQIQVFSHP